MTQPNFSPPSPLPQQQVPYYAMPYGGPSASHRPGIISAIGILSIIVACFSVAASLISGCEARVMYTTSKMFKTMTAPRASVPAPVAPAQAPAASPADAVPSAEADGLPPSDRQTVLAALAELQPLSAERHSQLEAFLTEQGVHAFPTGGIALTPQRVRNSVTSSSVHESNLDSDPGYTTFVTSWGTLKVYDDHADFTPEKGSGVISVTADVANPGATSQPAVPASVNPALSPSSGTTLTAAEVQGAVQRAQQSAGGKLTTAQLAALKTALEDPNQQLITPGTAWSPVRVSNVAPDGSAYIVFSGGFANLTADGQLSINSYSVPGSMPTIAVDYTSCALVGVDALLCIGLAVYLFVAGLYTLRQSPRGRLLHLLYAVVKIPLAIAGTAVMAWMNYSFMSGMMAANPTGVTGARTGIIVWAVIFGAFALLYPVGLLIALNTPGVREYYRLGRAQPVA